MANGGWQPLYINGKRDMPARRYYNPDIPFDLATGEGLLSRRQYDERYGRIAGSTNERQAAENRARYESLARRIAEKRGEDWNVVKNEPRYQEMIRLMRYKGTQTEYESKRGRTRLNHQRIWQQKFEIGEMFGDDMTADDWHALMSPDTAEGE